MYRKSHPHLDIQESHPRASRVLVGAMAAVVLIGALMCSTSCSSLDGTTTTTGGNNAWNNYYGSANYTVNNSSLDYVEHQITQRDYFESPSSAQSCTVMVYMCGADLESESGAATADINEMIDAEGLGDNVNVILETGGAQEWQNSVMDSRFLQRWRVSDDGVELLDNLKLDCMTRPETLGSFIQYCATNYPADRNILILWDHGGGTIGGYGYDENYPHESAMSIPQIASALKAGGVKFDMVGFDACLMSTAETMFALEPYTDYVVASQRSEPGSGWYYSNWLATLDGNPQVATADLGQQITSDYVTASQSTASSIPATLSMIDETKLPVLFRVFDSFSEQASIALSNEDFVQLSQARAKSGTGKDFTDDYDMVDLAYLANNMSGEVDGSKALIGAIRSAVVCNATTDNATNDYGISVYYPYTALSYFPDVIDIYSEMGFSKNYATYLAGFVTVMCGGQLDTTSSAGATDTTATESTNATTGTPDDGTTTSDLANNSWYMDWLSNDYSGYYADNSYDSSALQITQKGDQYVLSMTDDQWNLITDVALQVKLDDGQYYDELGLDNRYDFDADGDLVVDFDGYWVTLDDQLVAFYYDDSQGTLYDDSTDWSTYGHVPATVNGKNAYIYVYWDRAHPDGYVAGYRLITDTTTSAKGLASFKEGDQITYLVDRYNYDGSYLGTYTLGDATTFDGDLAVTYSKVTSGDYVVSYQLTDVYGNLYWTSPLRFTWK